MRFPWPFPGETKKGDEGNATRAWQDRLREEGLLEYSTGTHDAETVKAIAALRESLKYEAAPKASGSDKTAEEPKTGGTEGLWTAWAADKPSDG